MEIYQYLLLMKDTSEFEIMNQAYGDSLLKK